MEQGWIKLHRKILENPVLRNPKYGWLWVILLLKANHEDKKVFWNGEVITIKAGQFLTGRKQLAKEANVKESTIEDILRTLETRQQIRQQKTNKFRIITILNWATYQSSDIKTDKKPTTKQQQTDTNKNEKNEDNEKTKSSSEDGAEINSLISLFKPVNPDYQKFFVIQGHRKAIQFLIKEFGIEKAQNVIRFLPQLNSMPYAPTVTTPLELRLKLGAIKAFMEKERNKNQKGGVIL